MPFRVEGTFENLCLHVLNGSCPIADPDGPEPWRLTDATAEGVLVGFFAADAAGKLTHHGQRSHVHALAITSEGQQAGGHVDSTGIAAGAKLFVPASK
jgi:alpha-acetolactate decarboxylase